MADENQVDKQEFRETLEGIASEAYSERDFRTFRAVRRILRQRNRRRFDEAYDHAVESSKQWDSSSGLEGNEAMEADGAIIKVILDWLSNGGFEKLLEFILKLR